MDDTTLFDLFGSLSREMGTLSREISGVKESLSSEMKSGFDRIEARVARHGGMLNGGARQITRLIEWSEKIDTLLADRDATIADLTRRIEKLEGNR